MKKILLLAIAVMSCFGMVSVTQAGLKLTLPVTITATSVYGSFGTARNSTNAIEYLYYFDYGTSVRVFARDAVSASASCVTTNPTHLAIMRGAADSSYFYVIFDDTGQCTSISHGNGSVMEPKVL